MTLQQKLDDYKPQFDRVAHTLYKWPIVNVFVLEFSNSLRTISFHRGRSL
jgi:hypothetical protein